jgi:hypothetical protein
MGLTRRKFLATSAGVGANIVAAPIWKVNAAVTSRVNERVVAVPTGEWMANTPASAYRAYRSKPAKTADATTWVQIDLGETRAIDLVKVYPANEKGFPGHDEHYAGEGFPVRFKIECSNDSEFHHPRSSWTTPVRTILTQRDILNSMLQKAWRDVTYV